MLVDTEREMFKQTGGNVDRERVYNNISNIQREMLVDRERVYHNISNNTEGNV